jgi:hypothetical protein
VSRGNQISSNTTGGNNANQSGSFDLNDANTTCDNNTWSANTWTTGGYNQSCVTVKGSGP